MWIQLTQCVGNLRRIQTLTACDKLIEARWSAAPQGLQNDGVHLRLHMLSGSNLDITDIDSPLCISKSPFHLNVPYSNCDFLMD